MDEDMNKTMEGILKPIEDMEKAANPSGYVDPLSEAKEILDREAAFENLMNPTGSKKTEDFLIPQHPILQNWVNCTHCGKDFEVKQHMLKPAPY